MIGNCRRECDIVVAVVGQPNVGKSTLFNVLTGSVEKVGNFPGTTVAMNIGRRRYRGKTLCFVDLPGIYSLKSVSIDEKIARDFILVGDWDYILVLVDLTNGIEGLYLAVQILQLTSRVIVALTKWDEIRRRRIFIDIEKMSEILHVPVLPISALKKEGLERLLEALISATGKHIEGVAKGIRIDYGILEDTINAIATNVSPVLKDVKVDPRGVAVLMIMGNIDVCEKLGLGSLCSTTSDHERSIRLTTEEYIADRIHRFIEDKISSLVIFKYREPTEESIVYRILKYPLLGFITSIAVLFSAVLLAFSINTGFPIVTILEAVGMNSIAEVIETYTISGLIAQSFDYIEATVYRSLYSFSPVLANIIAHGVVRGVGIVISFIPLILITLIIMSAIEDSGLGPLMAVSVHSFFARFGLSGRAIYPMFICFGCNVPGIMSSRAALDDTERFEIIASAPFIPCQARLVVMIPIVGYLLQGNLLAQALAIVSIYIVGIVLYLFTAKIFRKRIFRVKTPPELILELPKLRKPNTRVIWWNSWNLTKHFIVRAGTVIVLVAAVVWILTGYGPKGYVESPIESFAFYIGKSIGDVIAPLYNLDKETSWIIGFTLLLGFIAKENLLVSLVVLTGAEEPYLALQVLKLSVPQGLAVLVLFMYYIPCIASVGAIYNESKSLKFTTLATAYITSASLVLSLAVYFIASIIL